MQSFKRILLALALLASFTASAQLDDPVKWDFSSKKVNDNTYTIIFKASIDPGWSLYSTSLPEGGPLPTVFIFTESKSFKPVGSVSEEGKLIKEMDDIFNIEVRFYANQVTFMHNVELAQGLSTTTITGNIEYQVCFEDKCVFHEKDFSLKIGEKPVVATEIVAEEVSISQALTEEEQIAEPTDTAAGTAPKERSLWSFFFIAFAAGLAGLLTPCVFPMIPMTVSFFLDKQKNRFNAILNAVVFGVSIVAIYTSLGLLVSLTNLGADFTSNIVSHWITNAIFFALFIAFAASFFGMFEIMLPSSLSTQTDAKAEKGGLIGSFFMALTLVLVSLSCVGPIVGALLVEAAAGLGAKPIIGMLGFSLAFAIPFTIFAIFPSLLKSLPKSGGWLNSVKVVLGFIVLAFSLKFLSAIDSVYHLGILTRGVFLSIWITIFLLLGVYLLGKIRFKFDSEPKPIGFVRMLLALASISFAIYLIPGLFGAPLSGLSGIVPAKKPGDFDLSNQIGIVQTTTSSSNAICGEPKYADLLSLPHNLKGYFHYEQALDCARQQGKPLFVDFVGHTCKNCVVMEQQVWSDPRVLEILQNDYVIVSLYVDERTKLPENEQYISPTDGKKKDTVGKRNSDLQITRFKMNSQPFYVLLNNQEEVLAEPYGFNTNVDDFVAFLKKGVEEFNKAK